MKLKFQHGWIIFRRLDHPVAIPVLSNAVPHASLLHSKGPAFLQRPLIYDRSIAFYVVLKASLRIIN